MSEEVEGFVDELRAQLDMLISLTAIIAIRDCETLEQRVAVLKRAGLGNQQIATICGTTVNTVTTRLAEAKRRGARRKPAR